MLVKGFKQSCLALLGYLCFLPATPHSASTVAAQSSPDSPPTHGFSFASLLETRAITFENFPVAPVMERAQRVADELRSQVSNPIFVVHVHRKEITPTAAVTSAPGMCIVVLNKNPEGWAVWDRFFGVLPVEQRMNLVEIAVAHEIGHCVHHQDLQAQSLLAQTVDGQTAGISESYDSELFADVYAGVYAQRHMGTRAAPALEALLKVRQRFAWLEPSHNTASPLQALMPEFTQVSLGLAPRPLALKALELLGGLK
jgi:hypothetical protein